MIPSALIGYGILRLVAAASGLLNCFARRFHREANSAVRRQTVLPDGFLNGQHLPPLAALPYGAYTVGWSGCEAIALYNALLALGRPRSLDAVASALERRGLLLNGLGGANLTAVRRYLRRNGVCVRLLRRAAEFDAALGAADCAILAYWTGRTLRRPGGGFSTIHTVMVQPIPGGVMLCNADCGSPRARTAEGITAFLRSADGTAICLLALGKSD